MAKAIITIGDTGDGGMYADLAYDPPLTMGNSPTPAQCVAASTFEKVALQIRMANEPAKQNFKWAGEPKPAEYRVVETSP